MVGRNPRKARFFSGLPEKNAPKIKNLLYNNTVALRRTGIAKILPIAENLC
jgi:hypothetical protein